MIVSASILSADLCRLGADIDRAKASGCDHIHFDVMDGVFVNNISYGLPVLKSVRRYTDMFIDAHLMIVDPIRYIKAFAEHGADNITFHLEAAENVRAVIDEIRRYGKHVGVALKPATSVSEVLPYAELVDLILIMTVEPGFGGQGFIPYTADKVKELRTALNERGLDTVIQVDGGINETTCPIVRAAGANDLVAGSYLFGAADMPAAVKNMRE